MYKITLTDGTIIENLALNGNNFISETEILPDIFRGNLESVKISSPDGEETQGPMKLIQIQKYGDKWWFILADKTPDEIRMENLEAATRQIMLTMAGGMKNA